MTAIEEKEARVKEMNLQPGDEVVVTNWIHRRIRLRILERTFTGKMVADVLDVTTGQVGAVGREELVSWLTQGDTEVFRKNQ